MACKVNWTRNASEDYDRILNYLENEWSSRIAEEFAIECLIKIELLSAMPLLGSISDKNPLVRKFLITKHNYLYYKFQNEEISLLTFADTRQEPLKSTF